MWVVFLFVCIYLIFKKHLKLLCFVLCLIPSSLSCPYQLYQALNSSYLILNVLFLAVQHVFMLGFKCVSPPSSLVGSSNSKGTTQAPLKKTNLRNGVTGGPLRPKDDECFGEGTEQDLDTDFDFEGNLALFDKAAVFSQIDGSNRHGNRAQHHSKLSEQQPVSYRHDENILEGKPLVYRQIAVPQHGGKEFCTGEI